MVRLTPATEHDEAMPLTYSKTVMAGARLIAGTRVRVSGIVVDARSDLIPEITWLSTMSLTAAWVADQLVDTAESRLLGATIGLAWAHRQWRRHGPPRAQ